MAFYLAGFHFLASLAPFASAQESAVPQATRSSATSGKSVPGAKKGKGSDSAARSKPKPPATSRAARSTESTLALPGGDLARLAVDDLVELIAGQRQIVTSSPKDETARRNMGLLAIEAANRALKSESLGRARDAMGYAAMIKTSLADTLWRVTQLAREQPARAQAALGLYYAQGILVPADSARSCDYFAKATVAGHIDAGYRAWQCASKSDPARAQQWLEQAAIGGNAAAEETMGRACIERGSIDIECAKPWLQSAAAQGRLSAVSVLAWLYIREGTPDSLAQAQKLYQSAAEAGDYAAQNNLGELFETGRGVPKEPAQAAGWYRKSAEGGFAPGQFNLARLLAYGVGTERDTVAAREWATRAQQQGIAQATELLKLMADAENAP